jgi:hypothetical protein
MGYSANPAQQASMAQQGALAGTTAGMGYTPGQVTTGGMAPSIQAGQIGTTDLSTYQNPFTEQVIQANTQDILRGGQMGMNQLGAQASAAKAFGGSRHGVAEAELGRGLAETIGSQSAQLRQAGFQQAQQAAGLDIANSMQAQMANQRAAQEAAQRQLGAQQFNVTTGMQGAQQRLGAASQLGALGQTSFQTGRTIQQDLAGQGAMQQAMQQALIDAAKGQYAGYTGAPAGGLGYTTSAIGASPAPVTTTQTRQPGLFDYLTMAATAYGGR